MTRFWWVRHGPTHAKTMVGWSDLPADLSDLAAIERLRDYLPAGAAVISSDLSRAVTTADAVQRGPTRLPHDPDLREIHFGDWELRSHAEIAAEDEALARAFWERPGDICPPGGEGWNQLAARVGRGVDRLIGAQPEGDVVVVAHFGAILAALQRAQGISAVEVFGQRIDPLSVTELAFDRGRWTVGRINHAP